MQTRNFAMEIAQQLPRFARSRIQWDYYSKMHNPNIWTRMTIFDLTLNSIAFKIYNLIIQQIRRGREITIENRK